MAPLTCKPNSRVEGFHSGAPNTTEAMLRTSDLMPACKPFVRRC
ncbi:hypothetical protein RHECNPAF_1260074 [Rhizobium etli CNPAF512]|nr:hypothetical protein RHECNPAF_1260074 [Rhizobium etli CNPAF512]